MRYVINDDDLEDWYRMLYEANQRLKDPTIDYILEQIEREFDQHLFNNKKEFLRLLRKEKT